ncbi:Protein no-on-transient A [Amphibalanus amphitrite]|uniref:Protein no-on-transient A n=1 Tax=Amphibalanus amphitrite TaxID=1232801 RepID=A0A6A4X3B1_AMPAM|nr:Protein no-on-transient A [Amphibalanus amphitrite]
MEVPQRVDAAGDEVAAAVNLGEDVEEAVNLGEAAEEAVISGEDAEEERMMEKLQAIAGPTYDLPVAEKEKKKFTNKCRLFVGNLTDDTTMDEFQEMFKDYRENAEKARQALNGTMRNGRLLKVRFSSIGSSLKVKRLSPWVSNELLELAFSVFGELERATVIVDERGKSTGEGIIEFAKKPCAQACLSKCTENSFFITESLCPIEVETLKEEEEEEGLSEKVLPKKYHDYRRERSVGPRFGHEGSFEAEYGARWKQLYEMEKQRREQLDQEIKLEMEKLRDQMEFARRQHETEILREQLRRREMEQERTKSDWDARQAQREQERRRMEEEMQRRQESMQARMRQSEDDLKRRQQENKLFMQANELNSLLDQSEQAMWGDQRAPPAAGGDQVPPAAGGYGQAPPGWGTPPAGAPGGFDAHGTVVSGAA